MRTIRKEQYSQIDNALSGIVRDVKLEQFSNLNSVTEETMEGIVKDVKLGQLERHNLCK